MHGQSLRDVELIIQAGKGLPRMDLIGHCDPYVILTVLSPDGRQKLMQYRTAVCYNTANPVWGEEVHMQNVPFGTRLHFQVNDKDHLTQDDHIGACELAVEPSSGSASPDGCVQLPIQAANKSAPTGAGTLLVVVRHRMSAAPPGPLLHCGPVRFRVSASVLAGALTGHTDSDGWLAYAAYKLALAAVPHFFPRGADVHWNTQYDKAQQIFNNTVMMGAIRGQHSVLYADDGKQRSRGMLRGGGDLVALLRGGVRGGQRRYYTYALTADGCLCFSETGAAFFSDFMSKHAMHAGCAETVVYAGEFCLLPPGLPPHPPGRPDASPAAVARDAAVAEEGSRCCGFAVAEGWTLAVDNNSGTYAPPACGLPALAALLAHNLRGLQIETVDASNVMRMAELHGRIPSRLKIT